MDFSDFTSGVIWCVSQSYLESIFSYLPDLKTAKALAAEGVASKKTSPLVKNKTAIIPVYGPISKRSSFLSLLFGGTSTTDLEKPILDAVNSSDVKAILLDIDSPGGTVAGIESLSKIIFQARNKKPVIAFANGTMASAAYWLGSAAQRIVVERTAMVGSLGVLMVHHDWSKADEKVGLKRTVLSAGKFKAVGNDAEPLSNESIGIIQSQLDSVHDLMITDISRNRDMKKTAASAVCEGQIFIGQQAVDAGLADNVGSIEDAINFALSGTTKKIKATPKTVKPSTIVIKGESKMKSNPNDFMALVEEHQYHFKSTKQEAIMAIMKKYPDAHRIYLENANK